MQKFFRWLFFWSWIVSLPIVIAGTYLTYRGLDRFYTFQVRYDPRPVSRPLHRTLSYEVDQFLQILRVNTSPKKIFHETSLPRINLFVPEANLAQLESHMPQSGFRYVKGGILIDGQLKKAKIKYRGDYIYHWGWDKKSVRVKTGKGTLFGGLRTFNLQAPKRDQQLNNYLSLKLANVLGLLAPQTEIVRLFLNGQDRGVYIFVEQPSETTLRNARLMPGDMYRGEMVGKDQFSFLGKPKKSWLFDSPSYWDKVAINNHYDPDSLAPLEKLLMLVKDRKSGKSHASLGEIMDMEAWGRFSAFETLASTRHTSDSHNWRLYYDPWRGKFYPFVWDPAGWMWDPSKRTDNTIVFNITTSWLHELLFLNADFLQARNAAFDEFFGSGKNIHFLETVSDAIQIMETEIKTDSFLRPADSHKVIDAMRDLEHRIDEVFRHTHQRWSADVNLRPRFRYHDSTLDLLVDRSQAVKVTRLMFDKELATGVSANIEFETPAGMQVVDLSEAIEAGTNSITIHASLMPDIVMDYEADKNQMAEKYNIDPGYYQIHFNGLDPNTKILSAEVNRGQGWIPAQAVDSITPTVFSQLYAPVAINPVPEPITWSGEVTLEGHQILDRPLVIEPGTTVNLAPGATLVLQHHLTAIGTREAPIRFVPARSEQEPWGAIVLSGRGADGSTLSHCEMAGGSGLKGDLFEYSAMLSIHDVKGVAISDCLFRDNHVVDDMVHTVYTEIRFDRVHFKNALSDALDLDISTASISDSHFENSGNDAVDLMTTQASITGSHFKNNGDKGISVGENSQLYAVNNTFEGNLIGLQSKDRSTAVLLNQTFKNNSTALHAYKKNWRYGDGGVIFLGKSTVSGGDVSAIAEKHSAIQIFDSYLQTPTEGKRIDTIAVEHHASDSALEQDLLPNQSQRNARLADPLRNIPPELLQQVTHTQRGNRIDS